MNLETHEIFSPIYPLPGAKIKASCKQAEEIPQAS